MVHGNVCLHWLDRRIREGRIEGARVGRGVGFWFIEILGFRKLLQFVPRALSGLEVVSLKVMLGLISAVSKNGFLER